MIHLKWNIDGQGRVKPPAEYINFVKKKRKEFYMLGFTSFLGSILITCFIVLVREGQIAFEVFNYIFTYNFIGIICGGIISYFA